MTPDRPRHQPDAHASDAAVTNNAAFGGHESTASSVPPSSPPGLTFAQILETDTASTRTNVIDVDSVFEKMMADIIWHHEVPSHPTVQRLGELLAFPVGIELMQQLRRIDANELDSDQKLIYAHLWERCVGWVNDQAASAAVGFIDSIEDPPDERRHTRAGVDIADQVSLSEVAVTTGLSMTKASMRIIAGRTLAPNGPLADTGAALRAGRISWEVASAFVDASLGLTDEHATAVQDRVLPRAMRVIDPETGAGCWRTRAWAIKELRRAVISVDPDTIAKRREEATARRFVELTFDRSSGTAFLTARLPAHLAMELHDTLNALAARLRSDDETTNPDQRPRGWQAARADALVEVIRAAGQHLAATGALPSVHGKTRIEVGVIIDLPTLMNLADHPGDILGYGPIDPHYARLLAAQADTWRRWVIEPVTGHLLDLGRTKYKPTQELRDYILAAYPECTTPECGRHAPNLEIDHIIEWADGGHTSAANLHSLCWQDHLTKTNDHTSVRMNADGTVTHTSRHGLTRTSEPYWHNFAYGLSHDQLSQDDQPPF